MNPQLQAMLQKAVQAFKSENFDAADLILQEGLQNDMNSANAIFELGIAYAKVNRLMEASAVFNCLLLYKKDDVRIPYNLGLIYSSQGMHQFALEAYDLALKIQPDDAEVLVNKGSACNDIKNYTLALEVLNRAIQLRPDISEAWSNKGIALNNLNLYLESINAYNEAIKLTPNYHEAWSNKSVPLNKLKRFSEASEACDKALSLKPDYAEGWANKGITLNELKRFDEAIAHYDKALSLKPDYAEGWANKGITLNELKRFDEAIAHYDKALSLKPYYAEGWSNKGVTLHELKRFDEAIAHYDKALSLKPDYAEGWANKGITLNELKRFDEAIAHYDKALSLKPDYAEGWSNKGVTLHELKRFDEAIAHYDKALSLKPDYHDASWNKSLSLLIQGDFENGLPLYESRWTSRKVSEIAGKRFFEKPTWLGVESLKDKTILLYGEQGLGDFIQFCRYAKLVANLGAKVILEVPQPLTSLMKDLEGVSQLIVKGKYLPYFDYQCPLLSLPLALKTNLFNIPNAVRYINIDNYQNKILEWKTRLGPKLKPRVGLVWSGNPNHKNDHNRSLLLADILPFLIDQFEYVSLQKEVREVDKVILDSNPHILSFTDHLNDFLDTAALIDCLDLVISVDTSVAHLSGALGKKTLTLLPSVPDWRWLLDREDCPWYPSMKLYRQRSIGDWNGVLTRVKSGLSFHWNF